MNAEKLEHQATTLRNQGQGLAAVEKYQQAKAAYLAVGGKARAAGMQHMIGVSYKIENNLKQAMPAYRQAITEYQEAGDTLGPGRVERDIGVMLEYHDRLHEAKEHLLKSRHLLSVAPESATTANGEKRDAELGITLAKLGLIALRQAELDEAEAHILEGLALIRKAGHPFYEMTALMHLAAVYFATKHYGRMLANLEASLGLIYEYKMQAAQTRRLAQIWGLMAHGYMHSGNPDTARYFAQKAFAIIDTLSDSAKGPIEKDIDALSLRKRL